MLSRACHSLISKGVARRSTELLYGPSMTSQSVDPFLSISVMREPYHIPARAASGSEAILAVTQLRDVRSAVLLDAELDVAGA